MEGTWGRKQTSLLEGGGQEEERESTYVERSKREGKKQE